ncbi:MAG: hypothetical protein U0572_15940 [Phycisphaerales bacterium]
MKPVSKLCLAAATFAALTLVACDGGAPAKKSVQVKPVNPANAVEPAGAKFKNGDTMGKTDKVDPEGKAK